MKNIILCNAIFPVCHMFSVTINSLQLKVKWVNEEVYYFAGAVITKDHTLGGLNNRNLFLHISGS